MSSILNILSVNGEGFNTLILIPIAVVFVAVVLIFRLSVRKPEPEAAKKVQNVKKQKVVANSKKDDNSSRDKTDKMVKENKPSPSPSKSVLTTNAGDKLKSNKQQQQPAVTEKSQKKNGLIKKQQVNPATATKTKNVPTKNIQNIRKQLESFITKEEEGEWQMVTTKKKQNKQDDIIEVTTLKAGKKTLEKSNKSTTKNKKAKVANRATNDDQITQDSVSKPETALFVAKEVVTPVETKISEPYDKSVAISPPIVTAFIDNELKTLIAQSTPTANVAFDEMGDDGWTDTKPQKKNRKRALRE